MTYDEWANLKHGDKIRFCGSWNARHIGDIETVYVDKDGTQYIGDGNSLFPLSEFDPDDWEKEDGE